MATKLKNLVITKVALVDEGSCSAAHIKLFKRKEGGDSTMKFEDIMKALTAEQQEIVNAEVAKAKTAGQEESKEALETAQNELETVKAEKSKAEADKVAAEEELAKAKEQITAPEEDILKSVDPAVRALIEKSRAQAAAAEAAIKKMRDEQEVAESISKAKELSNIGTEESELANILKSLKGANTELCDKVFGIMKSADAIIAKGAAFEELGSNKEDSTSIQKAADAWAKIEAAAEEISKNRKVSKEAAVSVVIEEQPDLYRKYLDAEMA